MHPTNGESRTNFGLNSRNEVLQPHQLIQDCINEAIAGVPAARMTERADGTDVDGALLLLATATNSPEIAGAIERDERRLASLAGIARRTEDASLEQSVVAEAIHLFGDKSSTSPFLTIAKEMGKPAALLDAIVDPETYRQATYEFATRFEDMAIINRIHDPEQRVEALLDIIRATTNDVGPFLNLLDTKQQQSAIGRRAVAKKDVELAATITNIDDRVQVLLIIARMSHDKKLDPSVGELLPQMSDDDPIGKAACIKEYMELSGSDKEVQLLHATARQIDDTIERAPFLAAVFAKTRDPDVGREVRGVLETHVDTLPAYLKNDLRAGLAIGLNDLTYALSISDSTLRYDTLRTVIVETGDLEAARSLRDPRLLRGFAIARNNMALAIEMANSADDTVGIDGITAVLELAFKAGNLQHISEVGINRQRHEGLIVGYLVNKDELEITQTIEDPEIRRKVQIGIAQKRGDLDLAGQLGAWEVVERRLMASGSTALPFDEVRLIQDPVRRIDAYFKHSSKELVEVQAEILASIRQLPEEDRPYFLSTLAEATLDPSVAYEALFTTQGAITNARKIELVARMIAVAKGQLLAGARR